jgi:hypothetical protein
MITSTFRNSLLLCCLLTANAIAQVDKASNYFPLQVGNIWEYKPHLDSYPYRHIEIVSDTVVADTQLVYRSLIRFVGDPSAGIEYGFYKYNEDSTAVYSYPSFPGVFSEYPILDVRGGIGVFWRYPFGDVGGALAITDTGSASFFGYVRRWAEVQSGVFITEDSVRLDGVAWLFAENLGPVREGIDTLVYAKVNGVEYGTPLIVSAKGHKINTPKEPTLHVYPNPAYQATTLDIDLASQELVEINVINVLGQTIRTLFTGRWAGGRRQFLWDGRNDQGRKMNTGIYFVVMKSQKGIFTTSRIMYLK